MIQHVQTHLQTYFFLIQVITNYLTMLRLLIARKHVLVIYQPNIETILRVVILI